MTDRKRGARAGPVRRPIVTLRLRQTTTGVVWTLRVGKPRRHGADWACAYELTSRGGSRCRRVYGAEGVQALQLVFQAVRGEVDSRSFVTLDGAVPAEILFPRVIPHLGDEFTRRVEKTVDRMVEREVARLRSRARRR